MDQGVSGTIQDREARTWVVLQEVYSAGEADGVLFLAMEFIDGNDLADTVRNGNEPLSVPGVFAKLPRTSPSNVRSASGPVCSAGGAEVQATMSSDNKISIKLFMNYSNEYLKIIVDKLRGAPTWASEMA